MTYELDYPKAKEHLLLAAALAPEDENICFDLGVAVLHCGEWREGRRQFLKAKRLNASLDHTVVGKVPLILLPSPIYSALIFHWFGC